GHFGPELKFAGYDHLVIHGKADKPVYIYVKDEKVEIRDAKNLWGKDVLDLDNIIKDEINEKRFEVASIGIAGENLVKYAAVMTGNCAAGRGGVGAVMGSKLLKAIVVKGTKGIKVKEQAAFFDTVVKANDNLFDAPVRESLNLYGTAGSIPLRNETNMLPCYNFQKTSMENAYNISGQYIAENGYLKNRSGCSSCSSACHRFTTVEKGPYEGTTCGGPEYETVAALGAGCGVSDIEPILKANDLCNRYGIDTISVGGAIQWAMECYQRGVFDLNDTNGLALEWGNGETIVTLVKWIANRSYYIGDLLAEGVNIASKKVGKGSDAWAIHSKGLEQSRAEVRVRKGYALSLAVNNRGPDHLTSQVYAEDGTSTEGRELIRKITGDVSFANPRSIERRGQITKWHEDYYALSDCLGLCTFFTLSRGYLLDQTISTLLFKQATGRDFSTKELVEAGERIINLERAYNIREGAGRKDDTLPKRLLNEPVPDGINKGMRTDQAQLDIMLDEYYEIRSWDKKSGWPYKESFDVLDLPEIKERMLEIPHYPSLQG
ncbi:MAG: aldehyde ferredoxin oxidoreductase C-terminal domain-containing protein, partial [Sphaerochaetaceae bacterium]